MRRLFVFISFSVIFFTLAFPTGPVLSYTDEDEVPEVEENLPGWGSDKKSRKRTRQKSGTRRYIPGEEMIVRGEEMLIDGEAMVKKGELLIRRGQKWIDEGEKRVEAEKARKMNRKKRRRN